MSARVGLWGTWSVLTIWSARARRWSGALGLALFAAGAPLARSFSLRPRMRFALFGAAVCAAVAVQRRAKPLDGIPFLHAVPISPRTGERAIHALTSTVLVRDEEVTKVYLPGLLPRAIYWLAFQAPFPYMANAAALQAAIARRNLAGTLTLYWYGASRVARAFRVDDIDGHPGLVSEFIPGTAPTDQKAARRFLFDLTDRFDSVGLPTWQVDPRQPRALGNLLEKEDGTNRIVDLESGLVSPLASPRAWRRAFRRGLVPLFDDVFFDIMREYVTDEAENMTQTMGAPWLADLDRQLSDAEEKARRWHASEPRIWGRIIASAWGYVARLPRAGRHGLWRPRSEG